MAEARPATDLYYLQKRHLASRYEGYYTFTISVPTPSTLVAQLGLFAHRVKYALLNRLWPASPLTLVSVMTGVTYMTVTAKGESWVRSGWLAEALWRTDTTIGRFNPLHPYFPTELRVGYLAATASFFGMLGIVSLERLTLRVFLSYQGWLFGRDNKIFTTIWGAGVNLLTGKKNLTYAFHMSLPTLPLPSLKHTLECFLESVEPLMDEDEFAKTKQLAKTFAKSEGPQLQRYLWLKWLTSSNYVLDWWESYVYLAGRTPIMVNSNYYVLDSKWRYTTSQTQRASSVVHHFLRFKDLIETETLEPMTIRNLIPLCMLQYKRMFGTTRIPGRDMDELQHTPYARHIVVQCRGLFYKLNVYHGARGTILKPYSPNEIKEQLDIIVEHANGQAKELPKRHQKTPSMGGLSRGGRIQSFEDLVVLDQLRSQIGMSHSASTASFNHATSSQTPLAKQSRKGRNISAFTAGPRSRWAEVREIYFSDGINRKSLDCIEKAAFILHLEDRHFTNLSDKACAAFCDSPTWYDKSINVHVFDDGYLTLNCEHSWADAPAIAHLVEFALLNELIDYEANRLPGRSISQEGDDMISPLPSEEKKSRTKFRNPALIPPTMLKFEIDDELQVAIDQAHSFASEFAADVDLKVIEHLEYGKGFIKKCKCSPDAFVQMALQLTYFRIHGKFSLVYESSMTRLFRLGRTETTRSLSNESTAVVRAMVSGRSREEVIDLLRTACEKHSLQNKQCMAGKGIDRHLFALYVVSRGIDVESEFLKTALSLPWVLSSSQQPQEQTDLRDKLSKELAAKFVSPGGGFGPVTQDGYGVSYMFAGEDMFFFHISSKKSSAETSSERFAKALMESLDQMAKLFKDQV